MIIFFEKRSIKNIKPKVMWRMDSKVGKPGGGGLH